MITILKFYAPWCKPCAILAGRLEDYEDMITNINIEQEPEKAKQYHVRTVPTMIFFKDDVPMHRVAGLISPREFQNILDEINDDKSEPTEDIIELKLDMLRENFRNFKH